MQHHLTDIIAEYLFTRASVSESSILIDDPSVDLVIRENALQHQREYNEERDKRRSFRSVILPATLPTD